MRIPPTSDCPDYKADDSPCLNVSTLAPSNQPSSTNTKNMLQIFILFFSLTAFLSATDLKILHMKGIFDLDNDDLEEFLTVEEGTRQNQLVSMAGYYEIDELGYPQLLWYFEAPRQLRGSVVDALMTDMDGSGSPEIVVATNAISSVDGKTRLATLYLFDWAQGSFSKEPSVSLPLSEIPRSRTVNNLDIIDIDGDGRDEVALSLQGEEATISVVALTESNGTKLLKEIWGTTLSEFATSLGRVHVTGLDYNRDGLSDLIAFSPERNILRVKTFLNVDGQLTTGPDLLHRVPSMAKPLARSMLKLDWNNDGQDDLLLPFQSGHIVSLSLTERKVSVAELGIDAGPLSDLKSADFNQDSILDLLLVSGEQGIVTLAYGSTTDEAPLQEYFSIAAREEEAGTQIFSALPEIVDDVYIGTVVAGGWNGAESEIFYFELGSVPEYPEEILVDTYRPEEKVEEAVEEPVTVRYLEGQLLPAGILPTYVLPVNQTFAYTIPEEDGKEFFSFRWLGSPPRGMYFHYETRSIEWVPDETQLGAYELSFLLKMKIGETVDVITTEDGTVTYQVIPELATVESRFWIYVNDPPKITSQPVGTEFVATSQFIYQIEAIDKNEDARLRYTLEKSPEGMTIDQEGLISWQTDASHIDIYEVRVVVSDGFDRDVQTFKLFSRGQVVITSYPELEASVGRLYEYKVEVQLPNKQEELVFTLLSAPYGMTVDNTGLIAWTPQSTQVDSQRFTVVANHGIAADTQHVTLFVNHPPILTSIPDPMTKIALGDTVEFFFEADDPNEFDVIRYNPVEMPPGMRIDPSTGRLLWVPTKENLDFSTATIEITDGRVVVKKSFDFFVNAPIHIVSEPVTLGAVGETYEYRIITSDLNRGSLLTFSHITPAYDLEKTKVYAVTIEDEIYRENIERYIGEFKSKKTILIDLQEKGKVGEETVARLNLKKFVQDVFYEDGRLIVVVKKVGGRYIKIKDLLWHFFEGNKGKPPKVMVERVPFIRYTLLDFPDGMFVDELTGVISWTPTLKQYDTHTVTYMVSDGYTKDEQSFELYINYSPTIISTAPKAARVDDLYKYRVVVEDKNSDKELTYQLIKAPKGMQISRNGKITWVPTASQINSRLMAVMVSDGYDEDIQETKLFVNIPPTIISQPKPVALTNYEYRYRMATEDLNGDKVRLRAIKIPKYAKFNEKTGQFRWKPRMNQRGIHDVILTAIDQRGAATSYEFQIHVFEDPSAQQFVSTSWPLLLALVGVMFSVGVTAIQ